MSTKLHDFARQAVLGNAVTPRTVTANVTGANIDLLAGDGRCLAVQQVGAVSGSGASITGKVQESADTVTWADVSGATFTAVTAADNAQAITFDRTLRYVRYLGTVAGSSPSIAVSVLIAEQRKQL